MSDQKARIKNPFTWFDACYVLSDPVTQRQDDCRERLTTVGIYNPTFQYAKCTPSLVMNNMRRNPAVEFAVNLGHIKNVVHALDLGAARPVFFEDDVDFMPGAEDILGMALAQLPEWWSVLYLGGHPREPITRYSDNLVHAKTWSCAEGYAINGWWLAQFFDYWLDHISKPNAMFDFILGEFAKETERAYATCPLVTHQPDGWSFIGTKTDSKRDLIQRGWKNNLDETLCD